MLFGNSTNKNDKWIKKIKKTYDPAKQQEAIKNIVGQTTLESIAFSGEYIDSVRKMAIERLENPKTLMQIAVENVHVQEGYKSWLTEAAGRRYLQVAGASRFFPEISKVTKDKDKIAVTAVWAMKDNKKALAEALVRAYDIEVVRHMSSWNYSLSYSQGLKRDEEFSRICSKRIEELEIAAAAEKAKSLTDKQKAAFVKNGSNPTGERGAMARQIKDDKVLAQLLRELTSGHGDMTCIDVAEAFTDADYLKKVAEKLNTGYQKIYPVLVKKCAFTPEYIIQDKWAPKEAWDKALDSVEDPAILEEVATSSIYPQMLNIKAAKKIGSQERLAYIALHPRDEETGKAAIAALTDRALLAKVARASRNIFLRMGAAWRLQDPGLIRSIEMGAKPEGDGHMVIVTVKKDWEQYEERCIRCGAVHGHEDDEESTTYYGKPFSTFPCRPDMPTL